MKQKFSMCMHRLIATIVIITGVCAILGGCSAGRLAYGNGERLSYWWFDSYLDFDASQAGAAKAALAELFAWHRSTELPDYVQFLGAVEKRLQVQPGAAGYRITPAEIEADLATIKTRLRRMTERAAPALADLAMSLQPAQLERLQKKLDSGNAAYRKEYLKGDVEDRQRRRFKKLMQQAEYWFGDFTPQQETALRSASDARPFHPELAYADRLARQAALIDLLKRLQVERPGREAAAARIAGFLDVDAQHAAAPQYRAYFHSLQEANVRLAVQVINSASDAQRLHALGMVRQWMRDLRGLSAQ